MSNARPPGAPRPRLPPPRAVAENVLELEKWIAPDCAILEYLRAQPKVAGWIKLLRAQRLYRYLREGGFGSIKARQVVGHRVGKDERTLQRWGLVG
jgi:hypothetical protein